MAFDLCGLDVSGLGRSYNSDLRSWGTVWRYYLATSKRLLLHGEYRSDDRVSAVPKREDKGNSPIGRASA